MVSSVQPIQTGTANLNKIGFAADEKASEAAQPQVNLETPKDEFVKIKKDQVVKLGAGIGAGLGLARFLTGRSSLLGVGITAVVGAGIGAIVKHFSKKD